MLLRFSVSNHRSIQKEQELSLVASALKDSTESLIAIPSMSKVKVLPSSVIFGPNASGKSNMVAAFARFRYLILESHRSGDPNAGIRRNPFALSAACKTLPTRFDADLLIQGIRYNYGFEFNDEAFQQEWLYSYPEGTRRKLFERTGPTAESISFGTSLKGKKQTIAELMRHNSLYLSTAAQNQHKELSKISKYFDEIQFNTQFYTKKDDIKSIFSEKNIDSRTIEFLKICNTGVVGYRRNLAEENEKNKALAERVIDLFSDFAPGQKGEKISDDEKRRQIDSIMNFDRQKIDLEHRGEAGTEFLSLDQESAGTLRLLALLQDIFYALDNGSLVVIDEIDASLHTQVCEAILYLFSDKKINKNSAQIIATTHDTNLLKSKFLRRDQIWLVEKNDHGASDFYSLADIRTRIGDNFELGYMQGRYGAVPFTQPVAELFASLSAQ